MEEQDRDQYQDLIATIENQNQVIKGQQDDITQLTSIISSYKTQITIMEQRMNSFFEGETLLRDSNHRNDILISEIERLNKIVFEQGNEVEEWKNKAKRLDLALQEYKQFELSNRDYVLKASRLADEVERLKDLLTKKQLEFLQLQQELLETQQELERQRARVKELEDRLAELESETPTEKALKALLVSKTEIIRLQQVIQQLNKKNDQLQQELDMLNEKYNNQLRANDDLRTAAEASEKRAKKAEQDLLQAQKEIERLNNLLKDSQNKQQPSDAVQTAAQVQKDMDKMQDMITNQQQQQRESDDKLRDALKQLRDAEARIAQLEKQIKDLEALLQMTQDRLKATQLLSATQGSGGSSLQQQQDLISDYEKRIQELLQEIDKLRNAKPFDDRMLKRQIQDLQCLIVLLCAEIESLRAKVR